MYSWLFLLSLFCVVATSGQAQYFAEEHWHQGNAIVESGDTLSGALQYSTDTETIQIRGANNVQTYSARKLLAFQFHDKQLAINRLFYVFPYAKVSGYQTPVFFELLERGNKVTLLQREILVIRTNTNRPFLNPMGPVFNPMPVQIRTVEPQFYFFYADGKIKRFKGSHKQLSLLLPNYGTAMKKFVKEKGYNPQRIDDLMLIIRQYNTLNP